MQELQDVFTIFQTLSLIFIILLFFLILRMHRRIQTVEAMMMHRDNALVKGTLAPDFQAKNDDGHIVGPSFYAGKSVCLIFFGIDCPYCKSKIPSIRQIIPQAKMAGTEVILVCQCKAEEFKELLVSSRLETRMLISSPEDDTLWQRYNLSGGIPYFVLIDEQGKVQAADYVASDAWDETINRWID